MPAFIVNLAAWVESKAYADDHPINTSGITEHVRIMFDLGASLINSFVEGQPQKAANEGVVNAGVQAIFYAMILDSFVAFEALAADIGAEAVNFGPCNFVQGHR